MRFRPSRASVCASAGPTPGNEVTGAAPASNVAAAADWRIGTGMRLAYQARVQALRAVSVRRYVRIGFGALATEHANHIDLDRRAERQRRDADRRSRGIRLGEVLL